MCPRVLLSPCILLAYKLSFYNSTRVLPAAPSPAPAADFCSSARRNSTASGAAAGNGAIRRLLWRDGILLAAAAAAAAVSSYFASVGRRDADFGCKCSCLSNSAFASMGGQDASASVGRRDADFGCTRSGLPCGSFLAAAAAPAGISSKVLAPSGARAHARPGARSAHSVAAACTHARPVAAAVGRLDSINWIEHAAAALASKASLR